MNSSHCSSASPNGVPSHPSTTAGESTASHESTRLMSGPPTEHTKEVLELKFPRCCVCGVDWYSYDADNEDEDRKPSASGFRTSPTKLYPLPQCQCNIKLSVPFSKEVQSTICSATDHIHYSPQDIIGDIHVHKFKHLAVCRPCLEKKIETSEEVLTKDYQQNDVENGQRDVKFSIPLKCDFCSQKFMKRKVEPSKLEEQGKQLIGVGGRKKGSRKDLTWFDSVSSTIRLVGWMKRQKRRARREDRSSTGSGEDKRTPRNWWKESGCSQDTCSSDECYSLSSDDSDSDSGKDQTRRQIAQQGELSEYYRQEMHKYQSKRKQQEQEDEEVAKKLFAELEPAEVNEEKLKQEQADLELAKKWQEEEEKAKTTQAQQDAKRKADSQPIETFFSKQSKTEQTSPAAAENDTNSTEAAVAITASIDLTEEEDLDPNLSVLMEMGYTRQTSEEYLKHANNDVNLAASMLLSAAADHEEK